MARLAVRKICEIEQSFPRFDLEVKNTFVHFSSAPCARKRCRSSPAKADTNESAMVAAPAQQPEQSMKVMVPALRELDGCHVERCPRPRRMNKVRLTANANSFAPSSEPRAAGQAHSFDYQVQQCVTSARSLLSSWPVVRTECTESKTGWSLLLYVNKQHERHVNDVIARAKQAMLDAAESTTNLYLWRYAKDPTVKLPQGFAVIFLGIEPQANTCWKFLQQGKCHSTCTCDHPNNRKNVIIRTTLVD